MRLFYLIWLLIFANVLFASELSTDFFSSKERDIILSDPSCVGFFGCAGAPGQPKYCALTLEKGTRKAFVKFYDYDLEAGKLSLKDTVEISENLFSDLFILLDEEIQNATPKKEGVLDGWNIEFGVRKKDWKFTGINTTDNKTIAFWMGRVGTSNNIDELRSALSKALSIKEKRNLNQKLLTAPEGYKYNMIPSESVMCQTKNDIWIIKNTIKQGSKNKIILYRISKDFGLCEEIELPVNTNSVSYPENLCSLSDNALLFSYGKEEGHIYKYDISSKKLSLISDNIKSYLTRVVPLDQGNFLITKSTSGASEICIYSTKGRELFTHIEKETSDGNIGIFTTPIVIRDKNAISRLLDKNVGNGLNYIPEYIIAVPFRIPIQNMTGTSCCALERIAKQTFKSCIFLFNPRLELLAKSSYIDGMATDCSQLNQELFVLVQEGALLKEDTTISLYNCSLFFKTPFKVAQYNYSNFPKSVSLPNALLFFSQYSFSPYVNTVFLFKDNVIFPKNISQGKNLFREEIIADADNIYMLKHNMLQEHRLTVFKYPLESVLEK